MTATTISNPVITTQPEKRRARFRGMAWVGTLLVVLWIIASVLPIVSIVLGSVKTATQIATDPLGWPQPFQWSNFVRGWNGIAVGESMSVYFANTILFSIVAVVFAVGFGTGAAYVIARRRNRISILAEKYYHVLYALPFLAYIVPTYSLAGALGMRSNPAAVGAIFAASWLPLTLILMFAFFSGIPLDVIEAAKVDGASEWRIFHAIVLPMSKGAVMSNVLLAFIYAWNNLSHTLPLLVRPDSTTVAPGLLLFTAQYSVDVGAQLAAMVISIIPLVLAYLLLHKHIMESFRVGSFR